MPRGKVSSAIVLLALSELAGCAVTQVYPDGTVEYWGLAHVTVRGAPDRSEVASVVAVEGVGALLMFSPIGSGITFGYGSQSITVVRDNAVVYLPPLSVRHATERGEQATPASSTSKEEQQ